MRIILITLLCALLIGCDSADAPDCFRTEGPMVEVEIAVASFERIVVEDDINLVISQGLQQRVVVRTGENLLPEVEATVDDGVLRLKDNNGCNWVRDYGVTTVEVATPELLEIRNSSSFDVRSQGVLAFDDLQLISNTTPGPQDILKSGDFYLQLDCRRLRVRANGQSVFYLSGRSENADFGFTDEFPRLEAADLLVERVQVFQRSANVMIVHPLEAIRGTIFGTGDVIAVNRPPIVEVETRFTGKLRFRD